MKKLTLLTALGLAAITAPISILGLCAIFTLAFLPIGIGLEVAKLVVAAWLHRNWSKCKGPCRYVLFGLLAILMVLTAFGLAGYLSRAYLVHQDEATRGSASEVGQLSAQLENQIRVVARSERSLVEISEAIEAATKRGRTNTAMQLRTKLNSDRVRLGNELRIEEAALAELKTRLANASHARQAVENELGSLRHIASLFNLEVEPASLVRGLTLLIAVVFELLTVLLLVAATSVRKRRVASIRVAKRVGGKKRARPAHPPRLVVAS